MNLQSPRGTRDILPEQQPYWQHARQAAQTIAQQLGYAPITTPTFEEIAVFERAIGEGTDIRDKELFLVHGKHSEEGYALRPEGTAGIARAYIEHGMHTWPQPVRLYSFPNCFRYERPQKGRYREHYQFDLETFGEKGPAADAWTILAGWQFLQRCGLKHVRLKINSLGQASEREEYIQALKTHLLPLLEQLSEDSQQRIHTNPLRILDSKDPKDQELLTKITELKDFFGPESTAHFTAVCDYLTTWQIPYTVDNRLVRGLDYYSHTTFEFIIEGSQGAQNSIGGGGRYDGLLPQMGGQDAGAVGMGLGLDRITEAMQEQQVSLAEKPEIDVFVIAADPVGIGCVLSVLPQLLEHGLRVDASLDRPSLGAQLKAAGRSGARYALLIGEQEAATKTGQLKDMANGSQREIALSNLITELGA